MNDGARLLCWNVNGIRAAARKGFSSWLSEARPDVLCLQEIKARPDQLGPDLLSEHGYHVTWAPAQKPGYSGVATFSRRPPDAAQIGLGEERFDAEGRTVATRHGDLTLINGYFPNSRRDLSRMDYKTDYYRAVRTFADARRAEGELVVICGDLNTAHRPIDLKNWKANQKSSGFTPAERTLLDEYVDAGWTDAFRALHPEEGDHYTWWSNRPGVRDRNVGWRIDYHLVAPEAWPRVAGARIHPGVKGSDHCPIELIWG